jgi:ketosteroid isomerase-like protein
MIARGTLSPASTLPHGLAHTLAAPGERSTGQQLLAEDTVPRSQTRPARNPIRPQSTQKRSARAARLAAACTLAEHPVALTVHHAHVLAQRCAHVARAREQRRSAGAALRLWGGAAPRAACVRRRADHVLGGREQRRVMHGIDAFNSSGGCRQH